MSPSAIAYCLLPIAPNRSSVLRLLCSAALFFCCADAAADVVIAEGSRHEDVKIQVVRGGMLFFTDSESKLQSEPIDRLESVYFDRIREVEDAERFMAREDWIGALDRLLQAYVKAQTEAQELWIHARLARVHNELGDYIEAAGHAAAVIAIDPAPAWTHLEPSGELDPATFYSAGEADHFLSRAKRRADDPKVVEMIDRLISKIEPVFAEQQRLHEDYRYRPGSTVSGIFLKDIGTPAARKDRPWLAQRAAQNVEDGATDESDFAVGHATGQTAPDDPDVIDGLLQDSKFEEALRICEDLRADPGDRDLARYLHQYGRALDGAGQRRDAALMFMRCVTHFEGSVHAIRSLIETAVICRDVFGDGGAADRLLDAAAQQADEIGQPEVAQRARRLIQSATRQEND